MHNQNPFSIYDFLGYLIPGALIIYICLFLYSSSNYLDIIEIPISDYGIFELDKFIFFVIVSYSVGHLINFVSSITVERYANWKYNYPSKYLMGFNQKFKFWSGSPVTIAWKSILLVVLLPIAFWDFILGEILRFKIFYTKKADDYIIALVKAKGANLLDKIGSPLVDNLRDFDFHRV